MLVREARSRPKSWPEHRATIHSRWALPFHGLEWVFQWTAYGLSRWAFLEMLEYIGSLSVLVAIVFYFMESGDRKKQKHYQAWQVINTAQGKGGSGGRIEAMHELNVDHEPLVGVDASGAFLQGVGLHGANLLRCDFSGADLRMADLSGANLEYADLQSANFRWANLRDADLEQANLDDADLAHADLSGIKWTKIASIEGANIREVRNAPAGFVAWAIAHKAVVSPTD
jgi:Pentapeptide repeats (8 copies)